MAQEKPELSLANQKTTLREGRWGGPPENQGKQRARPSQANKTKRKESIPCQFMEAEWRMAAQLLPLGPAYIEFISPSS